MAAAIQFLTLAPPLIRRPLTHGEMGRSVGFFPVVGALIGMVLAGLDLATRRILPPGVASAILLAAWVAMTGAFHLDGFLDSCDGLFGGRNPEERLRILRDERVGAFAVSGGVLILLLKYTAIASLHRRAAALVLAPTLGRWAMAMVLLSFPYRRVEGLGRSMKELAGRREGLIATAVTLGVVVAVDWRFGLIASLAVVAAGVYFARLASRRLEGLTGDIYGATCEIGEVAALVAWAACETCLA
jgi:adenosylcobinamide-GDP ribazoletransferase